MALSKRSPNRLWRWKHLASAFSGEMGKTSILLGFKLSALVDMVSARKLWCLVLKRPLQLSSLKSCTLNCRYLAISRLQLRRSSITLNTSTQLLSNVPRDPSSFWKWLGYVGRLMSVAGHMPFAVTLVANLAMKGESGQRRRIYQLLGRIWAYHFPQRTWTEHEPKKFWTLQSSLYSDVQSFM